MDNTSVKIMQNEISLIVPEPEEQPLVDEDAPPLVHVVGNEFDLQWRSVWIHGQKQSVRLLETSTGMKIEVMNKY